MSSPSSLETRVNRIYHLVILKDHDKRHEIEFKYFKARFHRSEGFFFTELAMVSVV